MRSLLVIALFALAEPSFPCREAVLRSQETNAALSAAADTIIHTGLRTLGAYGMLEELTGKIGGRLSGSPQAAKAVRWAERTMRHLGFDSVWTEPVMVPHWIRGPVERASFTVPGRKPVGLKICALGGSIATPGKGVEGEVVEVHSLEEARALGAAGKGKIVFFNRPMDVTRYNTFEAYGGAVDQRWGGASAAAQAGAIGVIVRSMTEVIDDVPHTGAMGYQDSIRKIPAAAVSSFGAERLSAELKRHPHLRLRFALSCRTLPDVPSANVIGEMRGSEEPNDVVVFGGHLDSWDKGKGAHDDGAGCVQSMEALHLIQAVGLRPRRTLRVVLFMNEENGLRGGLGYAKKERPGEKLVAAIETDAGGFSPRGFGVSADSAVMHHVMQWGSLLDRIGAGRFRPGGDGADIGPLREQARALFGLRPDQQRYFDYHHSDKDTIDKVNPRELELGAEAVAILAYAVAEEGL